MENSKEYYYIYKTSLGAITVVGTRDVITQVRLGEYTIADGVNQKTELNQRVITQLEEYLAGKRNSFDLPLMPKGTLFQRMVWDALCNIPYGKTKSYKQIAEEIGNPKACRAVGMANNKNPILIFIPCHRVIGANGSMVGYAAGLKIKEMLLNLEKVN